MLIKKLLLERKHIGKEIAFCFIFRSHCFSSKLSSLSSHSLIVLFDFPLYFVLSFEGLSFGRTTFWFVCELSHVSILYQQWKYTLIICIFFIQEMISNDWWLILESLIAFLEKVEFMNRKENELQINFALRFVFWVVHLRTFLILAFNIMLSLEDHLYLSKIEHKVVV